MEAYSPLLNSTVVRWLAYLLFLLGCLFIYDALSDLVSGTGEVSTRSGTIVLDAKKEPAQFKSLMAYQWIRAMLCIITGKIFHSICERADKLTLL